MEDRLFFIALLKLKVISINKMNYKEIMIKSKFSKPYSIANLLTWILLMFIRKLHYIMLAKRNFSFPSYICLIKILIMM
jgi:hypothetical protein